jgi:polyphosphate kinase
VAPVESPALRKELRSILDLQLSGEHDAWEMQSDGTYRFRPAKPGQPRCHQALIDLAEKRHREASRLRRRRPKGFARRSAP